MSRFPSIFRFTPRPNSTAVQLSPSPLSEPSAPRGNSSMPHETDEILEIRQWLTKAKHDWAVAKQIMGGGAVETDVAAFHCQQAVEKLLKAYLVSRRLPFEKVHDLRLLLNQCTTSERDFDALRDSVEPLTLFAV